VDRAWVKSLWSPAVRWTEVTEEGFRGGPVMPDAFKRIGARCRTAQADIARSGIVGRPRREQLQFQHDLRAAADKEPASGKRIDYQGFSRMLEEKIRARYEARAQRREGARE
jgi:hypothetical protein